MKTAKIEYIQNKNAVNIYHLCLRIINALMFIIFSCLTIKYCPEYLLNNTLRRGTFYVSMELSVAGVIFCTAIKLCGKQELSIQSIIQAFLNFLLCTLLNPNFGFVFLPILSDHLSIALTIMAIYLLLIVILKMIIRHIGIKAEKQSNTFYEA